MDNQEAAPSTDLNKKNNKNEKQEEDDSNKNEIIIEKPKEKIEEKKEEPKENKEIPEKKEILINTSPKPPAKKKRVDMDEFEKFMDLYPYKLREFEFDFYGDTLKPDCIFWKDKRKYYVFFNLNSLKNALEEKWENIFKDHPKTLESLKQPLENYKKLYHKSIYEDNGGLFEAISTRIKCLFQGEKYDNEVRERAKVIAFLLSQVDNRKNQNQTAIGMVDSHTFKIDFYPYKIFDIINDEIRKINIKLKTDEETKESLNIVSETLNKLYDNLDNDYSDTDKVILKSYLANEIIKKLEIIERGSLDENSENYEKMKELRNKVNNIIQKNMEKENDKSFFFDDDTFEFKIIKNTKNNKLILLNSVYIKQFYDHLVKIFVDLRDQLLQFDDNDYEIKSEKKIDFLRRHINQIKDLEQLNARIKKEINTTNNNIARQGIDMTKSGFEIISNLKKRNFSSISQQGRNIVDNYEQIVNFAIEKELLNKTADIIYYRKDETIKLIKEFDLKEKLKFVEDERFNSKTFNGILISRNISDPNNPLTDLYSVDLI